jgi:PAS domain S-box-containing protein
MMTSREINNLLRDVFASLRDAVLVVDPHTRMITDCSPSMERIFGYRRDEIIGRTMEFLNKEGRLVGSEQAVTQVMDDGGQCVAIVVVVRDSTDRKSTKEAIERDRAELKAIYELAPVLLCTLDADRRVLHANKAFTEFTGVPESELLEGRACGVFGCINARDDPRGCGFGPKCQDCQLRLAIEDTQKTGREHRDVEYRATLEHDGARRDVVLLGSTVRVVAAGHPNLLLCLQDITLRVQAEDTLKQREAELADAQTMARIGSWRVVLEQGAPVWSVSEELYRIYDYPPDIPMTTETGFDRIHPDDRERVRAIWSTALLGQNPTEWEHRLVVDGRVKWIHVRAHSRFDENGRLIEVTGTNQDVTEWKEAEEQLEFQARVLDQVQDTIIVTDLKGQITFANRAGCDAIGLTPESVIGNTVHIFGEDSARGATQNEIIQATRAAGQWRGIVINRSADGGEKSIALRTRLVRDVRGNPTAMCGIGTDVTERILAEEDLRHSEERYRKLVENLNDVIYTVQTDGTISYVSSVVQSIFGYTPAELIGRPYSTLIHPDDLDRIRLTFADVLEDRPYPSEYRMWAKDGAVRWVQSSSRSIRERGRVIGLQGRLTDITELKLTEEALRENEEKFRILFETMVHGVVYQDAEGHIISANHAAEKILGLTLGQMLGRKSQDPRWRAIHEDGSNFPGDAHPTMVALRTGKKVRNVIMGVSRFSRNEYVWININAVPQFKPGNTKPHQVFATLEDITERKKAETALAQSEQKLKDSHIKLRSLAEHLLHAREQERRNIAQEIHDELGQVLTALKMDLRWMEKRLEPSQERLLQKLRGMIGLTDQTIEKVQRLSSQLRPRMLDDLGLTAAIEWLGADFSRRTRIRCKVTVELTESRIGGNSTTVIFRMVQEALTNVERHAKASAVVVELREVQERVEIRVQDNGVGITEKQAEGPTSFGLIGIRERAQGLDGEVSIHGEPGKGTTVAISIPYPGGGALA